MKRLAALLAVIALVGALAFTAWRARPRPIELAPSFAAALAEARERGTWLIVHLRRSDRPLGAEMDRETLASAAVQRSRHGEFVHYRLEVTREPELAARLAGPGAALATLRIDGRGAVVDRSDGFLDADAFLAFLARARGARYPPPP